MIELTSTGKHRELTSLGPEKGKSAWTWELGDTREHEDVGTELELWGERRRGTAWAKNYEATCRKK
jgi:hypothetical protein